MSGTGQDSSARPPSLRQYFGSPKTDDDVFSQLADGSAMMASQANLTAHVQVAEAPGAAPSASAGDVTLPGTGPPTVPLISEQAPNVEHAFKQELQEALDYEERRPRFSIGPEAADEVAETVAGIQELSMGEDQTGGSTEVAPHSAATAEPVSDIPPTDTASASDFGSASDQVEEVPLTDEAVTAPPPEEAFPAASVGADLDVPVTPDDPGLSCEAMSQLPNTESDRQYDAWIPSERTQAVLASMSQSLPGTFYPSRENLTLPGCSLQADLTDPVSELMLQYLPAAEARRRSVLTADGVTQDDRGIRQLIQAGCYRAAVNLTGRLLANYGQGYGRVGQGSKHTANSVQLWFTRLALLVKLRQFSVAEREAQAWGDLDTADLFFQYYPDLYGGRRGSLVPFSFRVLLAELPRYLGQYQTSLDRLYSILAVCQLIMSNLGSALSEDGSATERSESSRQQALSLWRQRRSKVYFSIANCCIGMKDYEQAAECLGLLVEQLPGSAAPLRSAIGRVYLQLGDLAAARTQFAAVADERDGGNSQLECQVLTSQAFLSIAENNYAEAQAQFERALLLEPDNATLLTNVSVCLLYRGRLSEAVTMLETAVFTRPELLQETVLLNLCTLYELQTSKCNKKKVELLTRVGAHKGDGFNVGCLKLQSAA